MGLSWTSYPCICGGEVREEWDNVEVTTECDKCDYPFAVKEEMENIRESKTTEEYISFIQKHYLVLSNALVALEKEVDKSLKTGNKEELKDYVALVDRLITAADVGSSDIDAVIPNLFIDSYNDLYESLQLFKLSSKRIKNWMNTEDEEQLTMARGVEYMAMIQWLESGEKSAQKIKEYKE